MTLQRLPTYVTPFVGRVGETRAVADLLADPECRLLTLLGPGGIGKTRLAVHVAAETADTYLDGVHFVSLQAAASRDDLISAAAGALELQLTGADSPVEQLLQYLEDRRALLLFDNFEHLLDHADLIAELQAAAPAVDCLVTSRERLNLLHEWVFDVPGLSVPEDYHDTPPVHFSAVQLFLQTARRARPDFSLEAEYAGVARICRLVEGMPLGIELAASWVRSLSCDEIADELQHGLDILETTSRSFPQAHRDMRAVLAYSWKMLSEEQRTIFARLSVFRGGFSAEAAESVAGATRHELAALLDKSWLRRSPDTGRCFVHELLRQFGDEQLRQLDAAWGEAHQAHSRYFMHYVAQRWSRLTGGEYKQAHNEIEAELENVRAAWQWAVAQHDHDAIDAALASLWFFYDSGSRFQEGEQVFAAAVDAVRERQPVNRPLLGKLLARQGGLCFSLDRFAQSRDLLEESVAILRSADAPADLAFALLELGMTLQFLTHEIERAKTLFAESEVLYRQAGDRWGAAYALHWLSQMHLIAYCELGDPAALDESERLTQISAEQFRVLNNHWGMATTVFMSAELRRLFGDPQGCWNLATQGLEMYQALNIPWGISNACGAQADAALSLGWKQIVCTKTIEGLKNNLKYHLWNHALYKLHTAAELWLTLGEDEPAFMMLGAADHERKRLGRERDRWGLFLLDKLDEPLSDRQARAVERGQSISFKEAIKQTIAALERTAEQQTHAIAPAGSSLIDPLTERELEILRLLAQGKSNREIAQQLVLALGTVKTHIHNLCGKLHASSRLQAVARARELRLVD